MSQALRKSRVMPNAQDRMVIFINHLYENSRNVCSPETTTGGNALKFYASVRLDIRRVGQVKEGDEIIGSETKVKVRNKILKSHHLKKHYSRFFMVKVLTI